MAKPTHQDEILYCARCGISFVWSAEQELHDAAQPLHCPTCRRSLPGRAAQVGQDWYDRKKHYGGFIVRQTADIYVHRTSFEQPPPAPPG
ncbi:MAG: hypothetical protein KIT77_07705 [Caldilinea sp.]|nr:hypothetical protein [Caldilinea sp.]